MHITMQIILIISFLLEAAQCDDVWMMCVMKRLHMLVFHAPDVCRWSVSMANFVKKCAYQFTSSVADESPQVRFKVAVNVWEEKWELFLSLKLYLPTSCSLEDGDLSESAPQLTAAHVSKRVAF
eukprot:768820-Hanusia_phi.AAC.5